MTTITDAKKDPRYALLTSVLTGMLQLKALDLLEGTCYYKHLVKMATKRLIKELETHIIPDVELVCGVNDPLMYDVMEGMQQCIDRIAILPPEHHQTVSIMIDRLLSNPTETLSLLQIKEIDAHPGTTEPVQG